MVMLAAMKIVISLYLFEKKLSSHVETSENEIEELFSSQI